MNTHLLHKLEKYRNKIKYENKSEDKYLSKLDKYLRKSLHELSGGTLANFERVPPISLINSKGISILLGTYFPANIITQGKSVTKTVFEFVIVPYGSAIERYMYYYLDYNVDDNNRKHTYLRTIQQPNKLPRVNAQTVSYKLKLYIYAYNQELAIGMKDIKDELIDQLSRLRESYDNFPEREKRRMDMDARTSTSFNRRVRSYGDIEDIGDIGSDYGGLDPEEYASNTNTFFSKEKFTELKGMIERLFKSSPQGTSQGK